MLVPCRDVELADPHSAGETRRGGGVRDSAYHPLEARTPHDGQACSIHEHSPGVTNQGRRGAGQSRGPSRGWENHNPGNPGLLPCCRQRPTREGKQCSTDRRVDVPRAGRSVWPSPGGR